MQKRKTTKFICNNCGLEFEKAISEIRRNLAIGRNNYCSRKCSGAKNLKNFGDKLKKFSTENQPNYRSIKANPFKYYLRNCKRRFRYNINIDLQYLENLWNEQKGLCVYTNIPLKLNTHLKRVKDYRYTASLDRIDSTKGYIKGNVQFVSACINYMKNNLTHDQTIEFINLIKDS